MGTDVKALVLEWTDAFNRHDPDAYAGYMAEDCVFTNVGTGRRTLGRDGQRADLADLLSAWAELHVEITGLHIAGDVFTKEWIMTGVHTGDMPGIPATGRRFRLLGAGVGHVRDGRIAELTEYWNLVDFLTQVGALPPRSL